MIKIIETETGRVWSGAGDAGRSPARRRRCGLFKVSRCRVLNDTGSQNWPDAPRAAKLSSERRAATRSQARPGRDGTCA